MVVLGEGGMSAGKTKASACFKPGSLTEITFKSAWLAFCVSKKERVTSAIPVNWLSALMQAE